MKIIAFITYFLLVSLSISTLSQDYLSIGNAYFEKGQYLKADSVYTIGIYDWPTTDLYYNRAISRMYLNNMKGFCLDLKRLSDHYDLEGDSLRLKYCIELDTIITSNHRGDKLVNVIKKDKYNDFKEVTVYNFDEKDIARYIVDSISTTYLKSEKYAEFTTGNENVDLYIKRHIKYPKEELNAYRKFPGTYIVFYMQFDVLPNGKTGNVRIMDEKSDEFIDPKYRNFIREAIKVIEEMPPFVPGSFDDELVSCRFVTSIRFDFPK